MSSLYVFPLLRIDVSVNKYLPPGLVADQLRPLPDLSSLTLHLSTDFLYLVSDRFTVAVYLRTVSVRCVIVNLSLQRVYKANIAV